MVRFKSRKLMALLSLFAYLSLWHGLAHGVVLCMAEDGRSHLEIHADSGCSEKPQLAGCQDPLPAGTQIQSLCEDFTPDLLAHQRSLSPLDVPVESAISASFSLWSGQTIVPPLAAAGRYLQPTGPPRIALAALKTTVLRH